MKFDELTPEPEADAYRVLRLANIPVESLTCVEDIIEEFVTLSNALSHRWTLLCQYNTWSAQKKEHKEQEKTKEVNMDSRKLVNRTVDDKITEDEICHQIAPTLPRDNKSRISSTTVHQAEEEWHSKELTRMENDSMRIEKEEKEPTFYDETRCLERSARYALSPCPLVNKTLSAAISLSLRAFTTPQLKSMLRAVHQKEEFSILRNIGIHAEEAMEQDALTLILRGVAVNNSNPHWKDMIHAMCISRQGTTSNSPISSPVDLLESLVVDLPRYLKKHNPELYPEMPFKYFENYKELVVAELKLLSVPFILQNRAAMYSYPSPQCLFDANPILKHILSQREVCAKARELVLMFPELFGCRALDKMSFTFVGAGFPLTGIILHTLTGANINLVDKDETVIASARKFIALTDELSITQPGAIKLIHADASQVTYVPTRVNTLECQENCCENKQNTIINTQNNGNRVTKTIINGSCGNNQKVIEVVENSRISNNNSNNTSQKTMNTIDQCSNSNSKSFGETTTTNSAITNGRESTKAHNNHQNSNYEKKERIIVQTDILDLASALPALTTAQVMRDNASQVPIIRKRNVRGMSEIWYERFVMSDEHLSTCGGGDKDAVLRDGSAIDKYYEKYSDSVEYGRKQRNGSCGINSDKGTDGGGFRLIGEVTPPQMVINKATPSNLVVGLTSPININSCQLYANKSNYTKKLEQLEDV